MAAEEFIGGFVLCSIKEQKYKDGSSTSEVAGITRGESNRLQNRIFELSRNRAHPPITPRFDSVSLNEDKEVLVVWVAGVTSYTSGIRNWLFGGPIRR